MNAQEAGNPVVPLLPNSLYITTQTLILVGKWHWTLIATDTDGNVARHQWATVTGWKHQSIGAAEQHLCDHQQPRVYTNNVMTLCFLKVDGYQPQTLDRITQLCTDVFPSSYSDVRSNRRAGFTCRTFVLRILERMINEGVINRPNRLAGLEDSVKELSTKAEAETCDLLSPRITSLVAVV